MYVNVSADVGFGGLTLTAPLIVPMIGGSLLRGVGDSRTRTLITTLVRPGSTCTTLVLVTVIGQYLPERKDSRQRVWRVISY